MKQPQLSDRESWLERRLELLKKEKEFTRLKDELARDRQNLPWVPVTKNYTFDENGVSNTLVDLFENRSQLIVYHFMFASDWDTGCKSCSYWADNFTGIDQHLAARDISFCVVSTAPFDTINAFKKRMGWTFRWLSCNGGDFNRDYKVTFDENDHQSGVINYNYKEQPWFTEELPGVSVFAKNDLDEIFHTYSCYSRGLDLLNGAYNFIDLTPKGRNENGEGMSWVKLRDEY